MSSVQNNHQNQQFHSMPKGDPGPQYFVARPLPPTVGMTVVITLLFGVFGIIAAASAASKAAQLGYPTGKYWGTFFGITGAWLLFVILIVSASAASV